MAAVNTIRLSELEGAKRIDSEYYQPDYLAVKRKVHRLPTKTINQMAESVLSFGAYSLCNFIVWQTDGIPYLKAENIHEGYIDYSETMFIDQDVHNILKKSQVKEGQILFSMSGTTGNAAVAHNIPPLLNSNQDIAKITLKKGGSPYFVASFLNSEYGKLQTQREIVGSVQQHIFLWQIKNLRVPIVSEETEHETERIYKQALDELEVSKSLYSKAENLLLQELGFQGSKPKYELSYSANLTNAMAIRRVDAEYFQPFYDEIEKHLIEKFKAEAIRKKNFVDVTTGQYTEEYVEKSEGKPYIRGTDLKYGTVEMDSLVYIAPEKQIESKKAREGDIVVTRVGTIGLSARIPEECDGGTISDNLIRLRFDQKNLDPFYLTLFFGSPIGTNLMIRNSRGSVQQRLNQETLKEVPVPILPEEAQQKLTSFVQESHESRRKAKRLLEEAKRKVEEAIEKETEH